MKLKRFLMSSFEFITSSKAQAIVDALGSKFDVDTRVEALTQPMQMHLQKVLEPYARESRIVCACVLCMRTCVLCVRTCACARVRTYHTHALLSLWCRCSKAWTGLRPMAVPSAPPESTISTWGSPRSSRPT